MKQIFKICLVFLLGFCLCFWLVVVFDNSSKEQDIKEEPIQQITPLTFDQRMEHMQKCFDAAEKITTLAWGESTGSITIQLYLDTIGDVSNIRSKLDIIDASAPQLYIDLYRKGIK